MSKTQTFHRWFCLVIVTIGIFSWIQTAVAAPPKGFDFTVPADAPYKAGELLVRFAPKETGKQRSKVERTAILSSLGGGNVKRSYRIVKGLSLVKLPPGLSVEAALKTFNKTGGILHAQPNYLYKLESTEPNDPNFPRLWGMHNTGQTGGTADADIDAPEAWDIRTDGCKIF